MKKYVSMLLLLVVMCSVFTGCKTKEVPFDYIEPEFPYDYHDYIPPDSDHPKNNVAYC